MNIEINEIVFTLHILGVHLDIKPRVLVGVIINPHEILIHLRLRISEKLLLKVTVTAKTPKYMYYFRNRKRRCFIVIT